MAEGAAEQGLERYQLTNIALMSLGALVSSLAVSSISITLPLIAGDLHTSPGLASASVIVYLLVLSGLFLFFGRLGDVWGYRRVFLAGMIVFTIGSLLCALSASLNQLILFRVIQAVGAAMIASIGPAFMMRHIPPAWHGRAIAYVSGAAVLGVILGPAVGLAITDILSWQWIFLFNVPVGILILAAGTVTLPKKADSLEGARFDLTGACLFSCASVALVLAISSVHVFGLTNLITASLVLFTIAFWTLAIVYESATEDPAFNVTLFRNRNFTTANLAYVLLKMVFNGPVFLFPFYLHLVLGYSYALTGLIVIVPGAVMILSCPAVGTLVDRFSARTLCIIGALGAAVSYLVFVLLTASISLGGVIALLIFLGLARSVFLVPNTKLILDHTPSTMKGAASGIMKSLGNSGIILGIVIFQIAFSETLLVGEAAALYNHDPFTVPMPGIIAGFHTAFLIAAALSLAAVFFAWYARDATVSDPVPVDS
jgi:DHA2 family metal-tetracycline-proton antiporter-like MFS transporter